MSFNSKKGRREGINHIEEVHFVKSLDFFFLPLPSIQILNILE